MDIINPTYGLVRGSIPVGSTKTTVKTVVFLTPTRNRKTAFRRPDSRTLGVLADAREYQKADTFVSAFAIPPENRTAVNTARFPYARRARCYTGVPKSRHFCVCFCYPDSESNGC